MMNQTNIVEKESIWKKDLNLIFVYVVIFLAGVTTVTIMINVLNNKVDEILASEDYPIQNS